MCMQKNKSVLITGGAGFIGSHCVDLFLEKGYQVGVFDIKTQDDAVNIAHCIDSIAYIEGDIRIQKELDAVMEKYTYVLHLAADVSVPRSIECPVQTHKTNVTGTLHVFDSAVKAGIQRIVYASSAAVYGDTKIIPTHEDVIRKPLSPYGLHKVINEEYADLYEKHYGLQSVGLRFFNVYGSRQDPTSPYSGVISIFNKRLQQNKPPIIFGDGSATRDFIHVHDVARACVAAIEVEGGVKKVYNIGTGQIITIQSLVEVLCAVHNVSIETQYYSPREGDIMHSCALVSRMKKDFPLGDMKDIEGGLRELKSNDLYN